MRSHKLKFIFLLALAFASSNLWSQGLPTESVTVLKNFDAQLAEAERVRVTPEIPQQDTVRRAQAYFLSQRILNVKYPPPSIRALRMSSERTQKPQDGYLKLGVGYPLAFYVDGSYHKLINKSFDLGAEIFHHSAENNNVTNQRFSDSRARLDGTFYFDQGFAVNAYAGYHLDNVYYYGYNFDSLLMDTEVEPEDIKQQFRTINFGGKFFNSARTVGDINYSAEAKAYLFTEDRLGTDEQGFVLKLSGTKWFAEKHSLDLDLITDFTNYNDTTNQSLNNFFLNPSFTFHSDFVKAKLGLSIASHNDEFFFFPDVQATVSILGSALSAFAGAEGTLKKNTLKGLTDYNPFLTSRVLLQNNQFQHYYGGVKGNINSIEYSGQVGYKKSDNMALFVANPTEFNILKRFGVVYDTVTAVNIQGTLSAQITDDFNVSGTVNQNVFNTTQQEKPWHIPSLSINGRATYLTLDGNLKVVGEIFLENGVPYRNELGEADNLNALFDVNVGAEYYFNDNFGTFLQLNNLANNKRERWVNYPTFGFNVLVGASARF